jgi:hypothetical protein
MQLGVQLGSLPANHVIIICLHCAAESALTGTRNGGSGGGVAEIAALFHQLLRAQGKNGIPLKYGFFKNLPASIMCVSLPHQQALSA